MMMRTAVALAGLLLILVAPLGARAQTGDPIATVQSLIAAANSGGLAPAALTAGNGLTLALPGGASWSLTAPQALAPSLLPVTASGLTQESSGGGLVDATLQFGSGPALSARFLVNGGQIVAAALASQDGQAAPLLASAGAMPGGTIGITAGDASGDVATVSAKGPGNASVDATNAAGPVACSSGASALATINGSLWLCTDGVLLPGS